MIVPKNHEKLQVISELVSEGFSRLEPEGISYDSDEVFMIAKQAIQDLMPDLLKFSGEQMIVDATTGVSLEDDSSRSYNGLHTSGVLSGVVLQKLVEFAHIEDVEIATSNVDLCAVIKPVYVDPDPLDIVFGRELYVPFAAVTHFEPNDTISTT